MLQFGSNTYNAMARLAPKCAWMSPRFAALFSSNPTAAPSVEEIRVRTAQQHGRPEVAQSTPGSVTEKIKRSSKEKLKKAMEESQLQEIKDKLTEMFSNEEKLIKDIEETTSVQDVLRLAKASSQQLGTSLKIVSVVTTITNREKQKTTQEQEQGFAPIIQQMLQPNSKKTTSNVKEETNVKKETNFKRIADLSVPSMVQVVASLSETKTRHAPLLKYLACQIVQSTDYMPPKYCTSLLYSMSNLNFPHEGLIETSLNCLTADMKAIKPAILISALASVGILRYRDDSFLKISLKHLAQHSKSIQPAHCATIATTLATFKAIPENKELLSKIKEVKETELSSSNQWLDLVWALTILGEATERHYKSVLSMEFARTFTTLGNVPKLLKLQNINASAKHLMKDYSGPFLPPDDKVYEAKPIYSKDKEKDIVALFETLEDYLGGSSFYLSKVDLGLGFLIDAMIHFDSDWKCIDVAQANPTHRVAITFNTYESYSRGSKQLLGAYEFKKDILEALGYQILDVTYDCFSSYDKLSKRRAYLQTLFETLQQK